jgi:glucose/arabinose dehydrogenase
LYLIVVGGSRPVARGTVRTSKLVSTPHAIVNILGVATAGAVGPEGELFIGDDQNGSIYRVIYTGEAATNENRRIRRITWHPQKF